MNKRGIALIFGFMVIVVLAILGAVIFSRSISERNLTQRYIESTQAFWLAEAGINQAWNNLRAGFTTAGNIDYTVLDPGGYSVVIGSVVGTTRTVTATGFIPSDTLPRVQRVIRAVMNKYQNIPDHFYENAIYLAGNVNIGDNCIVNGNVFSGGTVTGSVEPGYEVTQNDTALHNNGLPALSFAELRQKSIDQGWYNPDTQTTTYPTTSFYSVAPTPPDDPGIPNVVFVNGDFTLVGGSQVVKGFIVVGGDTIYNAEIGGNASIDGCLYTRGNIWLHGGGGNIININGGVWAGGTITMTGNEQIDFNQDYMDAISVGLRPNTDVQITAWRDNQNPYPLTP